VVNVKIIGLNEKEAKIPPHREITALEKPGGAGSH